MEKMSTLTDNEIIQNLKSREWGIYNGKIVILSGGHVGIPLCTVSDALVALLNRNKELETAIRFMQMTC